MKTQFSELAIGDVLVAPFMVYVVVALALLLLLRPALRLIAFESWFSHPPLALLCLYVVILAALIVLVKGGSP